MQRIWSASSEPLLLCRIALREFCCGLLLTLGLLSGVAGGADDVAKAESVKSSDITIERVLGREYPDPYKHPASFTELANGDLYLAYYGGSGEYGDDTWVRGSRLVKGAAQWTKPEIIADTPFRADGNPVIWQSAAFTRADH